MTMIDEIMTLLFNGSSLIEAIHELLVTNQSHLSTLFFLSCSILHANTDGNTSFFFVVPTRTCFDTYILSDNPAVSERERGWQKRDRNRSKI